MHLTDTLTALRKAHGYSQEQLAECLGVSRQTISRWEVGEHSPSMKHLKVLSDLYQVPVTVFFQETPPTPKSAPILPEISVYLTVRKFLIRQRWMLGLLFCLVGLTIELFSHNQNRSLDDLLFLSGLGLLLFHAHAAPRKTSRKRSCFPIAILFTLIGLECVMVWYGYVIAPSLFYAHTEIAILYSLGIFAALTGIVGVIQEIFHFSRIPWNGRILCTLSLTLLVSVVWLFSLFHDITVSHAPSACWPSDFGKECAYAILGSIVIFLIK